MPGDAVRFKDYTLEEVVAAIEPDDLRDIIAYQDSMQPEQTDQFIDKPFPAEVIKKYSGIPPEFGKNAIEFDEFTENQITLDGLAKKILEARKRKPDDIKTMDALRIRRTTIAARIALAAQAETAALDSPPAPPEHHGQRVRPRRARIAA